MIKIYYVYAERGNDYGRTNFGYYTSRKKALKAKENGMKEAKKDKENTEWYKVDGYYENDWDIEEIKVY